MTGVNAIVTREGLIAILEELGFSNTRPSESTLTYKKAGKSGSYAVCFVFPSQTEDPKKVSGFAGIGAVVNGHGEQSSSFNVSYGRTTAEQVYQGIKEKIEPHCGPIMPAGYISEKQRGHRKAG